MTISTQEVIDSYFRCWNATDSEELAAAMTKTWAEDATSSDPLNEVRGYEALSSMFSGIEETYPGHSFRQVGDIDTHHNLVRWGWEMIDQEGGTVLDGIDVALLADDGRVSYLAGFFGASIPVAVT